MKSNWHVLRTWRISCEFSSRHFLFALSFFAMHPRTNFSKDYHEFQNISMKNKKFSPKNRRPKCKLWKTKRWIDFNQCRQKTFIFPFSSSILKNEEELTCFENLENIMRVFSVALLFSSSILDHSFMVNFPEQ